MSRILKLSIAGLVVAVGLIVALAGGWYWVTHSVEQPDYVVVESDGDRELRDYPAMVVAEATTTGGRQEGVRQGFRALAAYIFARNRDGERIAMTAPVIQQPSADDAGWKVRFVMPSAYDLEDLPPPAGEDVSLHRWPSGRMGAVRFGGRADDAAFARNETRLREWLAAKRLEPFGDAVFAYYDDPWTPGFLRRNEVLLRVR